ncbi:MAG: TraM recognition domain-containing protein [Candidatus Saccharibacteria bacterium]|nr:TraM recognition domain-containing protein [Candidatus Saccharibacteria bacterium]
MSGGVVAIIVAVCLIVLVVLVVVYSRIKNARDLKKYERGLKMVPLLIHLPPSTDDIQQGGRDERDVAGEVISQAQVMYSIFSSTLTKGMGASIYGQRHFSFEIEARNGLIKYYAVVPSVLVETAKQAIQSAYPTARIEEKRPENIFNDGNPAKNISGAELHLKKKSYLPIATYEDTKRDASMAILNALSTVGQDEGAVVQVLFRPASVDWAKPVKEYVETTQKGKSKATIGSHFGEYLLDIIKAPFEPPADPKKEEKIEQVTTIKQNEIDSIMNKMRYPAFETLIRVIASSNNKIRSDGILSGVVSAFSQFNSATMNSFKVNHLKNEKSLVTDYIFRFFPLKTRSNILNSVELASIFHLPEQNAIPNSQVERQLTKQVDGPARLATTGVFLGVNEFRGEKKQIYLDDDDRRRHMYVIGQTGMGKSVFLENIAFQDMRDGRGFAFIDPHGDAVEKLLQLVPEERIDDIIYFDPADIDNPVGMNMFEFTDPDQKDFIVQEGINMLQSLFDPSNQGFFGPRGQHMFRNAALLLMADPNGATFIDIPQCFTDPEFVKAKLKYVTDKAVYDYWTKEFPASLKSNDSGEVITWFTSKWGPFLSNTIMRNILGQTKSGFNIREIMDNKKIFLVNLSKGRLGDLNARLLGMIFVMKFQQAAMSRADIPENERQDFCLYVDEFQNFATESFESILSEARKYRLNLIVANQFMTQLTDKIREAILGNVGTIICGRVGVTDADLMVKAFTPTFTAEDLTKTANHEAICKVMIFGMPSTAFTMKLPAPMGEPNVELMKSLKVYSATKFGKTREEVEREINERWTAAAKEKEAVSAPAAGAMPGEPAAAPVMPGMGVPDQGSEEENFMSKWQKRQEGAAGVVPAQVAVPEAPIAAAAPQVMPEAQPEMPVGPNETAVEPTQINSAVVEGPAMQTPASVPENASEGNPTEISLH